jgi:hypothetical protein
MQGEEGQLELGRKLVLTALARDLDGERQASAAEDTIQHRPGNLALIGPENGKAGVTRLT